MKKSKGGKREGAGRPKSKNPKRKWSGFLSPEMFALLKFMSHDGKSQAELIEDALQDFYADDMAKLKRVNDMFKADIRIGPDDPEKDLTQAGI